MSKLRVRDLPLFWKLLLPFLTLIVLFGSLGAFLIVRDLSARAQDAVDQDLAQRSFEARSIAQERELYLVESANFATNIQGMADAIRADDSRAVQTLLGSVLALKTDVSLLAATDSVGRGIVELRRTSPGGRPTSTSGSPWAGSPFVAAALRDPSGARRAGLLDDAGRRLLVIAAPVCPTVATCRRGAAGVAVVGISLDRILGDAVQAGSLGGRPAGGAAIYDAAGHLLASAGPRAAAPTAPGLSANGRLLRLRGQAAGADIATLYAPLEVQGTRVGTLAATVPSSAAFATVRGTAKRLGLIVLVVMLGVIGVGALLSRFILAQLRPLMDTNRQLGRGQLSARAPVVSNDELGELARGVNQMAEQLQALYDSLELRVAQRTDEIQRLLHDRTEFFAAVSHDLRTPLAVIRNQALMMLSPKFQQQSPAEVATTIVASSDQLLMLINELLELSKAEAGRLDLDLERVRLPEIVKELRATIDGLAQAGALRVTVSIPRDVPAVLADPRRLREVLLNLVDNAVKYTPPGGRVSVAASHDGDRVRVVVQDNGIGIPEPDRHRIFEPFYRVKGNSPQGGQPSTGLGLALTKRFVEAHGGEISFESSPGAGTTFTFTLRTFESVPLRVVAS